MNALQTAVTPEVRCWAADLSKGKGGSEPKLCVVTTPADFIAAYLRVPFKHAYEDRGYQRVPRKIPQGTQ